ncbi:Nn.00g042500.m01.CDS01 [Neocucurbitaria sp. VM-36]
MATPQFANPIYHDPTQPRKRRSSSRKSFASTFTRSSSYSDSARTACPKDGDAFSYDPSHLRMWTLPQDLWDRLPTQLQSTLAAVQYSGAAVLTGFERLDKHTEDLDSSHPDHRTAADELLIQLDDLPPQKLRTASNASSVLQSDFSSPLTSASSGSQSGCTSPVTRPSFSQSHTTFPASPMSLGPPELSDKGSRSRDRSFSKPLDPHDAYYAAELSHLRTEALPRLRHKCHKVDTDWYEAKRTGDIATNDVNAFENWWAEKKCTVLCLNERAKRLATALGLSNSGMGWQP